MFIREINKEWSKTGYIMSTFDKWEDDIYYYNMQYMFRRIYISIWVTQDLLREYKENIDLSYRPNYLHYLKGILALRDLSWFYRECNTIPIELIDEWIEANRDSKYGKLKLKEIGTDQIVIDWEFIDWHNPPKNIKHNIKHKYKKTLNKKD